MGSTFSQRRVVVFQFPCKNGLHIVLLLDPFCSSLLHILPLNSLCPVSLPSHISTLYDNHVLTLYLYPTPFSSNPTVPRPPSRHKQAWLAPQAPLWVGLQGWCPTSRAVLWGKVPSRCRRRPRRQWPERRLRPTRRNAS